jgi:putative oxidoreductase
MLLTWLSQYRDIGLLFLRLGIGTTMVFHGLPKLQGGLATWEKLGHAMGNLGVHFFPAFWGFSSATVETLGGVLILLGFCFRPVTMLLVFNFIVATILLYKANSTFENWSHPAELLIIFFSLIFIGAGKYSIDRS